MKYFLNEAQRRATKSSCYFEFQKGKFRNKHWKKDSLCLHADTFDALNLYALFSNSIADFCYYAPTEVNKENWEILAANAKENTHWLDVIEELTPWAAECFSMHGCFTVCGI